VIAALDDLGPGLQDAALRCCCLLEGLEITEKRLGWSARSGKIVLRISLQRLVRHYEQTMGKFAPRIGRYPAAIRMADLRGRQWTFAPRTLR
jgi:hypothetical protein